MQNIDTYKKIKTNLIDSLIDLSRQAVEVSKDTLSPEVIKETKASIKSIIKDLKSSYSEVNGKSELSFASLARNEEALKKHFFELYDVVNELKKLTPNYISGQFSNITDQFEKNFANVMHSKNSINKLVSGLSRNTNYDTLDLVLDELPPSLSQSSFTTKFSPKSGSNSLNGVAEAMDRSSLNALTAIEKIQRTIYNNPEFRPIKQHIINLKDLIKTQVEAHAETSTHINLLENPEVQLQRKDEAALINKIQFNQAYAQHLNSKLSEEFNLLQKAMNDNPQVKDAFIVADSKKVRTYREDEEKESSFNDIRRIKKLIDSTSLNLNPQLSGRDN